MIEVRVTADIRGITVPVISTKETNYAGPYDLRNNVMKELGLKDNERYYQVLEVDVEDLALITRIGKDLYGMSHEQTKTETGKKIVIIEHWAYLTDLEVWVKAVQAIEVPVLELVEEEVAA